MSVLRLLVLFWTVLLADGKSSCSEIEYQTINGCSRCSYNCIRCNYYECTQCASSECDLCRNTCSDSTCIYNVSCRTCIDGYYMNYTLSHNFCLRCANAGCKCTHYSECVACIAGKYGDVCENDCSSDCKDQICSRETGECISCRPRRFGIYCNNSCSPRCSECENISSCTNCVMPSYWGPICQYNCTYCVSSCNKQWGCLGYCTAERLSKYIEIKGGYECIDCPISCKSCDGSHSCTSCNNGHWGKTCENYCRDQCYQQACNKQNGYCTDGCENGYYGVYCSSRCPERCEKCISSTQYTTCYQKFFNSDTYHACQCNTDFCSYKEGDLCLQCSNHSWYPSDHGCCPCSSSCVDEDCFLNGKCKQCKEGFYGDLCNLPCNSHCKGSRCFRNGSCISCSDGQYGSSCDGYCSSVSPYCKLCYGENPNSLTCTRCNDGMYPVNDTCVDCSIYCEIGTFPRCNPKTGVCKTVCYNGWYGDRCDVNCSVSNCLSCASTSPNICVECRDRYYLKNSFTCASCPTGCHSGIFCNKHNGSCTDGCKDGLSGEICDKHCNPGCKQCDQFNTSSCSECKYGLYGKDCEFNCSSGCLHVQASQTCRKSDGHCLFGCTDGFWSDTCQKACGTGCSENTCNRTNGICLSSCTESYYGKFCNSVCNENCLTNSNVSFERTCDETNGLCLYSCKRGKFGGMCNETCSEGCKDITCRRLNGTCTLGCITGYTGSTCYLAVGSDSQSSADAAKIGAGTGAGVVSVVVIVLVIVVAALRRRRRSTKSPIHGSEGVPKAFDQGPVYNNMTPLAENKQKHVIGVSSQLYANTVVRLSDISKKEEQILKVPAGRPSCYDCLKEEELVDGEIVEEGDSEVNNIVDNTYYNTMGRRVAVTRLEEYIKQKCTDEMIDDFGKIPKGLLKSCKEAKKSENVAKNKYRAIYPYDETRVKLLDGGSDYINASYIEGYNKSKEYIASAGPFHKSYDTTPDFWRMIWQEKCETMVMLTNPVEHKEVKCVKYWPDLSCSRGYGDIHVTCLTEDIYADFTIRILTVKKGSENLNIHHVHFTAWPDKGVPHDVTSMIEFRHKVRSLHTDKKCPMVVHCSAGIGRTGTFIVLDMLTCEGEDRGSVDIFGSVASLRYQRCNLVQTVDQYVYLHHALLHSLTFDCRSVPGDMFLQNYNKLLERNGGTREIDKQFQNLQSITEEITDDERATIKRNRALSDKNRKCADVPSDETRIRLHENRKPGASDYINAVFINSFRRRREFIVAQTPLPSTVVDFLSLMQQERCLSVVSMEEADLEDKTVKVYWPADNQVVKHGVFKLSCKESQTTNHYVLKKLIMTYHGPKGEETRDLNLFIFTKWTKGEQVPNASDSLCELVRVVDVENRSSGSEPPILVHCKSGAEKSCLFCAVSVLIEKMEIDNEVSVVNTLRQIKARRTSAISSIEQYKFCHQAVISYLQSFETYSNFGLRDSSTV